MLADLKTHCFANVARCLFYLVLSTIFGGILIGLLYEKTGKLKVWKTTTI